MGILDRHAELLMPTSAQSWFNSIQTYASHNGFNSVLFAMHTLSENIEHARIDSNYPEEWRSYYDKHRLVYEDPTVGYSLRFCAPLIWSPSLFQSVPQLQMYEEASAKGLRSGVTLPIHGVHGKVGMLCLVSDRGFTRDMRSEINHKLGDFCLLRDIAVDGARQLMMLEKVQDLPKLTKREIECLKWTALGKSSWEISQILRCSESTINFHVKNIREKLGVSSRRAAVIKAVKLGLIPLD